TSLMKLSYESGNCTVVTEFILLGFSEGPELQLPLFMVFLVIYIITLMGNLGMIMLIRVNTRLHTPMYFFLCNLSAVDICYSSVITPRMLMNLLAQSKMISFNACFAQLYFFVAWVCTECFLLANMAYDRYMAICSPLLYSAAMSQRVCILLVAGSCFIGFTNAMVTVCFLSRLPFCGSNIIRHFFCDTPPLLTLSSDMNEIILFAFCIFNGLFITLEICISYIYIVSAILKIRSSEGRRKAFSTCASHLAVVIMFFGTAVFMYMRPSSDSSPDEDRIVSVFYTVVNPMLNPLIYSLRNKEVKDALKRIGDCSLTAASDH
uniref:Olfactory receptor n=1 Tax=Podarcis muralis TaxID=64176 RepID=A0A670IUY2_PODMU